MRRIVVWITGTLVVVALAVAYQLNATGSSGKVEPGQPRDPAASAAPAVPGPTSSDAGTVEDAGRDATQHPGQDGKVGENK